jgi:hypothetical protein
VHRVGSRIPARKDAPDAWQRHLDFMAAGLRGGPVRFYAPPPDLDAVERITGP